ncbi:MAG: outer-membrane lipoprotein carrier protein LolA [Salinarimonas sp.]|nr:outer-membrane lipoprotein carrier protein LolA [Salinarimonas sp.]
MVKSLVRRESPADKMHQDAVNKTARASRIVSRLRGPALALAAGVAIVPAIPDSAAPARAESAQIAFWQIDKLPPPRPEGLQRVSQVDLPEPPAGVQGIAPGQSPEQRSSSGNAEQLSSEQIVARANDFFNGITTMYASFTQMNANGDRLTGELYVHRPGRLRFDYDDPATLQVIADGRQVAIQDSRLNTQDLYPISQTPLKFLLGSRVNLGRDVSVLGVERHDDEVDIQLEDRSTLGGTSRVTLTFDDRVSDLKRWRIRDPQGFTTTVALDEVDFTSRLDSGLFVILRQR